MLNSLNIKNEQIQRAVDFESKSNIFAATEREASKLYRRCTDEQKVMSTLLTYVMTMLKVTELPEVDVQLDLTYDTADNFLEVVLCSFSILNNSNTEMGEIIRILESVIASYLSLLAANEHNVHINAVKAKRFGFRKKLNIILSSETGEANFFEDISGMVTASEKYIKIDMERIISSYKKLTGTDLSEYNINSVFARYEEDD